MYHLQMKSKQDLDNIINRQCIWSGTKTFLPTIVISTWSSPLNRRTQLDKLHMNSFEKSRGDWWWKKELFF